MPRRTQSLKCYTQLVTDSFRFLFGAPCGFLEYSVKWQIAKPFERAQNVTKLTMCVRSAESRWRADAALGESDVNRILLMPVESIAIINEPFHSRNALSARTVYSPSLFVRMTIEHSSREEMIHPIGFQAEASVV